MFSAGHLARCGFPRILTKDLSLKAARAQHDLRSPTGHPQEVARYWGYGDGHSSSLHREESHRESDHFFTGRSGSAMTVNLFSVLYVDETHI